MAVQERFGWARMFPRDVAHWFGWIGFGLLAVSAAYSGLKRGFPKSVKLWLSVHCIPGTLSLAFTGIHIINKFIRPKPGMALSFITFDLMAIIVLGGIAGRYVQVKFVREYWRLFHIPLTLIFYLLLAIHVLQKSGLI